MIWHNSTMTSLYHSNSQSDEGYPCIVKITDTEILVEYKDNKDTVQYRGINDGSGHFNLIAPSVNGKATLHRFPDGDYLEGSWIENGVRGMWMIDLDD